MKDRHTIFEDIGRDPVAAFIQHTGASIDTELQNLPTLTQEGIARYVICGVKPGSFLLAVFAGERTIAEHKADHLNKPLLMKYFAFVETECPRDCHGSSDKVRAWVERGGVLGLAVANG